MGQKINPIVYRLDANKHWRSSLYVSNPYSGSLLLDIKIRAYLSNVLESLHVNYDNILIKRYPSTNILYISFTTHTNQKINISEISNHLKVLTDYKNIKIDVIKSQLHRTVPVYNAQLLGKHIVKLIETRSRTGLKKLIMLLKEVKELKGYKIRIGGRINGVDMARHTTYRRGALPIQSISSPIDYTYQTAHTKYGIIGIKVWLLYKGNVI